MLQSGRVVFSKMEEVQYGKPARPAIAELVKDAQRVFLMVSGTLNRETDEVEKVRRALGNNCVGTFDRMPAHSPRSAVIAAAEQAREARRRSDRHPGRRLDHRRRQGGPALPRQRRPHARGAGRAPPARRARRHATRPTVRQISIPTTLSAGEFSGLAGVTDEATRVKEMFRHPLTIPQAVILDPEVTRPHADVAVPVDRHPRRRSLRRGRVLQRSDPVSPTPRRCTACRCWRAACRG